MATIGIIFYLLIGIIATWFNYEMLKFLTESLKREVTDSYYSNHLEWKASHESFLYIFIGFVFNIFIWPITMPLLWLAEWYRKPNNKKTWKNPMRYAVREILSPKENV